MPEPRKDYVYQAGECHLIEAFYLVALCESSTVKVKIFLNLKTKTPDFLGQGLAKNE